MASSEIVDWGPKVIWSRLTRARNGKSVILRRRLRVATQPARHGRNRPAIHGAADVFLRMSDRPTSPVSSICRAHGACRESKVSCDSFEQPLQSPVHDSAPALSFNSPLTGHRDRRITCFRRAAISMLQTVESFALRHSPPHRNSCTSPPSHAWRRAVSP